jgi:Asp-tRNA(Asn)/Glu-tRNA(Gln) amidotransferase C subunit
MVVREPMGGVLMTGETRLSPEQVRAMAQAVDLELPPERLEQLVRTMSEFLDGFARVRALDVGDREPPTLSFAPMEQREQRS